MFDERLGVGTYFSSGEETDYLYSFIENYRTCGFFVDRTAVYHPANNADISKVYKYSLGFAALQKKDWIMRRNYKALFVYLYYLLRAFCGMLLIRNFIKHWYSFGGNYRICKVQGLMYYYTLVVLAYATFLLDNFNVRNKEKYSCLFAYVFFSVIFFISSFRYEVGSDYPGYKEIFEYDDPIEPLFALLIKAVKYIGGNYEVFVAIIFILSFGLKLFVFRKLAFRKGFYLSMMLFCSFYYIAYEMNAIRQGLAMSLTLLAVYYAYMRKKIKYITVCLLASFIHYTAFCFIPFYLLLNIKLKKIHIVGICLLCVLLSMNQIFNIFMDMASMYLGDSAMGDRILAYGENGDASSNVLFSSGTLRRLFFFGLIIYSIDKIEATERLKQIILWGAFLSIVTYLLFSQIGYFSIRLSAYYRIIECIWLSYFPFIFKNHRSQMIVIAFFFLYSILQVSSALMLEDNGLLPIRTIVFEDL